MNICISNQSSDAFSTSHSVSHWKGSPMVTFDVRVAQEAGQWVARSSHIPGLNLEAPSLVELVGEIREWAPELLIDNRVIKAGDRFTIVVHSPTATTKLYN